MTLRELFLRVLDAPHIQMDEETAPFYAERDGGTLRLLFEESRGKTDWRNNFRFLAIPKKPYKGMDATWFAHRGFNRVWKVIEPKLVDMIADPTVTRIDIAGYSHGAGVALLCYEYCRYHRPEIPVTGFGFGAPRVVWGPIPPEVKARREGFVVVRQGGDLVTHLPPMLFGYRHVGTICEIKKVGAPFDPIKDHYPDEYAAMLGRMNIE